MVGVTRSWDAVHPSHLMAEAEREAKCGMARRFGTFPDTARCVHSGPRVRRADMQGVTAGPDGNVWFADNVRGCVGRW